MVLRIAASVARAPAIEILVDGRRVTAYPGESVAAALLAAGIRTLRHSPRNGAPRGAFCLMGVCQECVVHIDGRLAQACLEPVATGMRVALGAAG